jgi:Glycosyltransferases, probably involved in cell wall biogenesis
MSGAFSAFRKEALLNTFMYSTSTVGEDTDMTFQIREKLKRKVVICSDAIFYIEPINRLSQLYTQRQRWQRGEIEVSQEYSKHIELKNFFSNFLIRRMIIDHTFLFPKMIWIFASIALLFFRYSVIMMAMSYFIIYILYVVVALFNYVCVRMLLRDFTEERRFYTRLAWVALTLPIYNFVVAFIRFVGILNTMTEMAVWNTKKFDDEVGSVRSVFKEDLQRVKETRK